MKTRKNQVLERVRKYPNIIKYFGNQFLEKAISSFEILAESKWSTKNYFISNYFMSSPFANTKYDFISELEKLLNYYLKYHNSYIISKNVKQRLTTKHEPLFQGIWSELIFTYFLMKNNIKIIEISKMQSTPKGEVELFDIKTQYGEIEVTAVVSKKGIITDTANLLGGPLEIDDIAKQIINKKIKSKAGKKIVAIDCTFIEELSQRLVESNIGFNINFKVFKPTSKNIILFDRNPNNQQVGFCKFIKEVQT